MSKLDLTKIRHVALKEGQYIREETKKVQIVLHHTAGNSSAPATIQNWNNDDRGKIATCIVVSGKGTSTGTYDGEICQCYSSKYWAYHLGLKSDIFRSKGVPYKSIDPIAIGIEICNWGPLDKVGDKYYNYVDREVALDQVCVLDKPYKGHLYYHAYTDAQIESVRQLLVYWGNFHNIPLKYNEVDMWDTSKNALSAVPGVYTHNSYRKDKSDISPQPKMIAMLKTLI
tara:strand:+ start:3553 stop:4236 length:684 start_codon:yes stop_codon:yes gene_type:complete